MVILGPFPSAESIAAIASQVGFIRDQIAAAGGAITITSPVKDGGNLELVRGDAYLAADGRAITYTFTGGPSLAGATVKLIAELNADSRVGFQVVGTISGNAVTFQIAATVTAGLYVGQDAYAFSVVAILADGGEATLLRGSVTVTE